MAKKTTRRRRRREKISIGALIAIGGPLAIAAERWKSRGWEFALLSLTGVRVGRAAEGTDKVWDPKQAVPTWACVGTGIAMMEAGSRYVNRKIASIPFVKL